jgi:hypothetical protein
MLGTGYNMRGYAWNCFSVTLGLLVSCSSAPSQSQSRDALINEFIERSFLREELIQYSTPIAEAKNAKVNKVGSAAEPQGIAFNREIEEALRPDITISLAQEYLHTQRAEVLERLLEWLRTPIAQYMVALSVQPFDYTDFNTYQVPKDDIRYDLIPRLDKATHTSELIIQESTDRAKMLGPILMGKERTVPSDYKLSPQIAQFLRAQLLRKQAFIYRQASNQDLKQYVEFLESPLGQVYVAFRRNALVAAHSKAKTVMAKLPGLIESVK